MSAHHPEPTDVGPIAGGDIRASDADRDQVVDLLSAAYVEGRLTSAEHEERIERAQGAKTFDDLVPLTRDLVPVGVDLPQPSTQAQSVPGGSRVGGGSSGPLNLVGILGGASRSGKWRVPGEINIYTLMGGVDLDMTEAEFESDRVVITEYTCMGGLDLKVPAGVNVQDETIGIMGGCDVKHIVPGDGPTIVLKGIALMGGADVKGPAKQIQRERRREQRRLGHRA